MTRVGKVIAPVVAVVLGFAFVPAASAQTETTSDLFGSPTQTTEVDTSGLFESSSSVPTTTSSSGESGLFDGASEVPSSSAVPTTSQVELPDSGSCPLVQVLAANGTSQATSNSDPNADTGWLAGVIGPAMTAANNAAGMAVLDTEPTPAGGTSASASSAAPTTTSQSSTAATATSSQESTSSSASSSSSSSSSSAAGQTRTDGEDGDAVGRMYTPYPASFGNFVASEEKASYEDSVNQGIENGTKLLEQFAEKCPESKIFGVGYSQGAQVMSAILRKIGVGEGPVDAEQVAGGALFSDPTRAAGQSTFEDPAQTAPAAAPGTDGEATAALDLAPQGGAPEGAGIAPNTEAPDFGALGDRVASFCAQGDLACDTAEDADIARVVANIGGQAGGMVSGEIDPIKTLTDVADVAGQSVLLTGADTVNKDIEFSQGKGFTINEATAGDSTLDRMVRYSDPTKRPADPSTALVSAANKIGGMALGAAVTVARDVITPANIAEIAMAGAASPAAAGAVLATKLAPSVSKLITPTTVNSGMKRVVSEVEATVGQGEELKSLATTTSAWKTAQAHGSYDKTPYSSSGATAASLVVQWIVSAASDVSVANGGDPVDATNVEASRQELISQGATEDELNSVPQESTSADSSALSEALAQVA